MHWSLFTVPLAAALVLLSAIPVRGQIVYSFSTSDGGWTDDVEFGVAAAPFQWGVPAGGGGNAWYSDGIPDFGAAVNLKTLTSPLLTIVANGSVTITVNHRWNFEPDFLSDGGQLRYRLNGGGWIRVDLFDTGGYNDDSIEGLGVEPGWNGTSTGFGSLGLITSSATISSLTAGNTLEIQLRGGWDADGSPDGPDWVIKQVEATNAVPEPSAYAAVCGLGLLGFSVWRRVCR